jgi:oligoribonuclease
MDKDPNNLIWVDLEMTGLDVASSTVIEIAIVITDQYLTELDRWPSGDDGQAIHQPADVLAKMDEWGRETHTKTGLLERVRQSSVDLAAVEAAALAFVQKYCPQPASKRKEGCPLAGNSIGQDRALLRAYMPKLEQYTSYRNVDVSTIKELVKRWHPRSHYEKRKTHGAMDDILASIEELQHYRKNVFISLTDDTNRLIELNDLILQAEEAGRKEDIAPHLHKDFTLIRAKVTGEDREAFLNAVPTNASRGRKSDQPEVRLYGDRGVFTCLVTTRTNPDGTPNAGLFWNTRLFIREQGQWRCAAWQVMKVCDA